MEYTINVRDESFPCIVCGVVLYRVSSDYEGQPDDGVMCSTYGNYGSTVWDPCDGSYLAFNICDLCILEASEKGRLMVTRDKRHVKTDVLGIVGWERVERPYIPWRKDLPPDNDECYIPIDELTDSLPSTITLNVDPKLAQESVASKMAARAAGHSVPVVKP